uniref:Chromosome 12 open reading frame 60 n=1 Tax=Catagonus wagneri TaxID=51154 RepID=A0A8C3WRN1_9CETA
MSSESEKDKERLVQAAKTFFFHMQDLASFTNALTKLFNSSLNTQIFLITMKEDGCVKDVFEQMLRIFKEMQSAVEAMQDKMQSETLCSKIATAVCSVAEKSSSLKEFQHSAKEMLKNVQTPVLFSVLNSGNILESLESSLSLLMKYPIMNLQLNDFYRKDTKEHPDASTSEKSPSPGPSKATTTDNLKQLQDALNTENAKDTLKSAADQLEQIVKTMQPILEILQKAVKTMETKSSVFKKASN